MVQDRESRSRVVLETVATSFNQGAVVGRGDSRHLEVSGATYASFNPRRYFWGYAWDALAVSALHHPGAAGTGKGLRILLIGLGGGTALHAMRYMLPDCDLWTAEIDPELVHVTRRHFQLERTRAQVVVGDGYQHVADAGRYYDVIIDDAFLARGDAARTEEMTDKLLAKLLGGLRPGGMLASNHFSDRENLPSLVRARGLFMQRFVTSRELAPPLGHNAILCGADRLRPVSEVRDQLAALQPTHARAALKVKVTWNAEGSALRIASRSSPGT